MKKRILLSSVALIIATLGLSVLFNIDNNSRKDFEQFLLSEYQNIPQYNEQELEAMPGPTQPDLAAMQDYLMTLDPVTGNVPRERLVDAYHYTKYLSENGTRNDYRSLEWESTSADMGGRTRALMYDPNDEGGNKVWAGGVTGGLWYNNDITDDESEWMPVSDFWSNISISSITYDPNDPLTFYVGTGEAQTAIITYRESSGVGSGIYKSSDGGESWELLPSTADFRYITDIKVRNEEGNSVIYAGVVSGIYQGTVHQSLPTDGLYRSDDGGASWDQVFPDIIGEDVPFAPSSIAIQSDGRLYVGTIQNVEGNGGATILMSDEGTEGSWTVFEDYRIIIENNSNYYLPGRVIMMPAPSDENIVYALIGAGYIDGYPYYRGRYMIKTEDKGDTWDDVEKPNSGDWATLAWHALTGAVSPDDPNTMFIGGLDVYRTGNGGNTWRHVSDWSLMYSGGGSDYIHADQHAQIYKPESSFEMVFGSDGGVFYTGSAFLNYPVFEEKNHRYNTLQFYSCDIHPEAGRNEFIGGLQDNGSLYYTGEPLDILDMVSGGDGAYCFYDKDQGDYFLTSVYYNRYYIFENGYSTNYLDYYSGIFINPADYDYKENTLYANAVDFWGGNQDELLRVTNVLSGEYGTYIDLNTGSDVYFSHIKYSPYSPDGKATLFVGSQSGRLFKVENAQSSPDVTEIGSNDFPEANISCVAIGGNEDTLLVTFSNYGVASVWQTYDGGDSWNMVEGNLPDMPVRWAIYHPESASSALLATEIGVWSSYNLDETSVTWQPDVEGMANVRVDMLKVRESDNTVLAATQGRGLFWTEYPLDPTVGIEDNTHAEIKVYPNPASDYLSVSLVDIEGSQVELIVSNIAGKQVVRTTVESLNSTVTIDISDLTKGVYLLSLQSDEKIYIRKFIKM